MALLQALFQGLCLCLSVHVSCSYKPVVFMHGLFSSGKTEDKEIFSWIQKYHPGTVNYTINKFNDESSLFDNMMKQVEKVGQTLQTLMTKHPQGIHLLCYSQGGLVCRGVLEHLKHNVDTFISLSSPQAGQFGDTSYLPIFPKRLRKEVYKLAYTKIGQECLSVFNYWNDPHQQELYLKYSKFLTLLNNDTVHSSAADFRSNFLRLKKLVLIGGPDDGVVTPWQSSQFGFYDKDENVIGMKNQKLYLDDSFGLRTIDNRGALYLYTMAGITHSNWYTNFTVFQQFILPHLT